MRPGELLRQLDRKLLPPLVLRVARLGQGPVRLRLLAGTALVSSLAVLATALWTIDHRPAEDQTVGEVTRVGVAQGDSIPGYVAATRQELTALLSRTHPGPPPETYALVAFVDYLTPAQLTPILAEMSVSEVFVRVPLAQTQTQIVRISAIRIPGDVLAGMLESAERKDREAADYRTREAALTGGADPALRAWYDSGARVARAEADAYRSGCACVYATVVRATPAALEELATRPEVRAVDPAPEVRRLERTVFSPPLPDQHDVVRPPADTALPPSATTTGAPPTPGPTAASTPPPVSARPTSSPAVNEPDLSGGATSTPVATTTAVPTAERPADIVTATP